MTNRRTPGQHTILLIGSIGPLGHLPASGTVTVAVIGVPLFWLMHDELFNKQGLITIEDLPTVAKYIGLDSTKFATCLETESPLEAIKADAKEAESLGVEVTPTLAINGHLIPGDLPEEILFKIIGEFLGAGD